MNIQIHRGTNEIGGSCVEIRTESTCVVLDLGLPLVNPDRTSFDKEEIKGKEVGELVRGGVLPDIPELYNGNKNIALLLSHAHQDHYGLMDYISPDCPVYLGDATYKLIQLTNLFTHKSWNINHPQFIQSGKTFTFGDIEVTPYLMDHSAFDAYAFLIKADGKTLFYSGDFRIHGRKAKAFDWFERNVEKNIDYLLMEGTTIGRGIQQFKTEADIENELIRTFNETNGIQLIYTSGQNIDRLVSIYRASKRTGKLLAIDFYIANILKELSTFGAKIPYPSMSFPEMNVFFPQRLSNMVSQQGNKKLMYRFKHFKITREEIDERFKQLVIIVRPTMLSDLEKLKNLKDGSLIYSMWNGYKTEGKTRQFIETLQAKGIQMVDIHTSGHADREGLKRMVEILNPKNLVPIHTFDGDQYNEIFPDVNILRLKDREIHITDEI